jgi:hypothetical protein
MKENVVGRQGLEPRTKGFMFHFLQIGREAESAWDSE